MTRRRLSAAVVFAVLLVLGVVQSALGAQPYWRMETSAHLAPSYSADLDSGNFNGTGYNDVTLDAVSHRLRYVEDEGAASILRMSSKPGYNACATAALIHHKYNANKNVGRWFCVKTQEDRYARFKILSSKPGEDLVINYVVWCKASDNCEPV